MTMADLNKLMTVFMINVKKMKPKQGQAAELIWSNSLHGLVVNAKRLCLNPANSAQTFISS